ncbi:MAG: carboxylesterase family protein, partial [Rhodococcus sp.]|nr:carboxylesterase family protein [Rhodococcus sp. (in: high G+C Gram-positive bacteria)]
MLEIDTESGTVRGYSRAGVRYWTGIPYGAPPEGALRFRAPQRPTPWAGIRKCDGFGPLAPQLRRNRITGQSAVVGNENCLTVNVSAPASTGSGLPVMVF